MPVKSKAPASVRPKMLKYEYDMLTHGVTASMIKRWREDRLSAKIAYIDGWYNPGQSLALMYGTAAHWCIHQICHNGGWKWDAARVEKLVDDYEAYYLKARGKAPWGAAETENHEKTVGFLRCVMPEYIKRCNRPDSLYNDAKREWVSLEETFLFHVVIDALLPLEDDPDTYKMTQIVIPIRGRIDGVFRFRKKLWIRETKNLSVIDEDGIMQKLPRDLQSNIYISAVKAQFPKEEVGGVLYDILRRPGLRLGKTETVRQLMGRVRTHVCENTDHYFMRFEAEIPRIEQCRFMDERLKPTLISMFEWWRDVKENDGLRYGYDNDEALLTKYGHSPFFHAITHGDFSALRKRKVVFNELED